MALKILPAQSRARASSQTYRLSEAARRKILRGIDRSKPIPADILHEIERQRLDFVARNGSPFGL